MGDIGLMGAPAKLDGKAVEGVKIFLGGKIGENPEVGAGWVGTGWARARRCQRWVLSHGGCLATGAPPRPTHLSTLPPARPCSSPSPQLAKEFEKGIPVDESVLLPRLRELLISEFGAAPKAVRPAPRPARRRRRGVRGSGSTAQHLYHSPPRPRDASLASARAISFPTVSRLPLPYAPRTSALHAGLSLHQPDVMIEGWVALPLLT